MSSFLFLLRDSLQKILLLSPLPLLVILLTVIAPPGRSPVSADGTFGQQHSAQQSLPNGASGSWYQSAMNEIERSEYEIRWQPKVAAYQSPNRKQNLRFTYHSDGFTVTPRAGDQTWTQTLRLQDFGRKDARQPFKGSTPVATGNTAFVNTEALEIRYTNTTEGMRQDFMVKQRPDGTGPL